MPHLAERMDRGYEASAECRANIGVFLAACRLGAGHGYYSIGRAGAEYMADVAQVARAR